MKDTAELRLLKKYTPDKRTETKKNLWIVYVIVKNLLVVIFPQLE